MAVERTLSIIKPDAVAKNVIGEIYTRFEKAGLKIVAARMTWLSVPDAEGFYAVHKERRADGRDRSEEGRGGNHPRGFRGIHRRERGPWFRWRRDGAHRNRLLLP